MRFGRVVLGSVALLVALLGATPGAADKIEESELRGPTRPGASFWDDIEALKQGIRGMLHGEPAPLATAPATAGPAATAPGRPPGDLARRRGPAPAGPCAAGELASEELHELQRLLNYIWGSETGGAGRPDGRCGPRTVQAVEALERAHGLEPTGVPSRAVLDLAREVVSGTADAVPVASPAELAPPPPGDPAVPIGAPSPGSVESAAARRDPGSVDAWELPPSVRQRVVEESIASCEDNQRTDPTNQAAGITDRQMTRYCTCMAEFTVTSMRLDEFQEMVRTRQAPPGLRQRIDGQKPVCQATLL